MTITTTAHRWEHGWELWIDSEPATQVASLDRAAQQVRDYLDTGTDHSRWDVAIVPEIKDLSHTGRISPRVDGSVCRFQRQGRAALAVRLEGDRFGWYD
ncbi:hypothetical protein [Rathayibacter sp. Leaf248]|uniref:hypothetical protein n=1 Tax=Rathayibacter sp. Leaf248 TaxID=2876555 RepID=UPI001E5E608B|nr:hypothetical protein [Rathayibacter sp. Leaf248]